MRGEVIDLEPPRAQVKAGRLALTDKMELIPVEHDVFHVVERLKRIDAGLHLSFHKAQEAYVLEWRGLNDKGEYVEDFVGAYKELDARLVALVERLSYQQQRDRHMLANELDRLDREKDAEAEHAHFEAVGPAAEQLAWAIRKDLGIKSRAFIPKAVKKGKRKKR